MGWNTGGNYRDPYEKKILDICTNEFLQIIVIFLRILKFSAKNKNKYEKLEKI
jgi:hypothetical protein